MSYLLVFQQLFAQERDIVSATQLLGVGSDFAQVHRAECSRILFLLSKGMVSFFVYSYIIIFG